MENYYQNNKDNIDKRLQEIWNYMKLNQTIPNVDLIIGCGCVNLDIPIKCAELYKKGLAPKILFAGGLGKVTKDNFQKSEAEIYKEIALKNGVLEKDIIIEDKSTNTGDNFRFAKEILTKNNIKWDSICIVHRPFGERRTYSSAQSILSDKEIYITSPSTTFEEYLTDLEKRTETEIYNEISVIVGDIQRMIIYPQFGWQTKNEVPVAIIDAYDYLKKLGYDKYILEPPQIKKLIKKYGILPNYKPNYFS